jgi:hypothetical protein
MAAATSINVQLWGSICRALAFTPPPLTQLPLTFSATHARQPANCQLQQYLPTLLPQCHLLQLLINQPSGRNKQPHPLLIIPTLPPPLGCWVATCILQHL